MPAVITSRLIDRRDELDLSNEEFARQMEISKGYLENILYGVDAPSMRVIYRFVRVLGLKLDEVTAATEKRQPKKDPEGPTKRQDQEKEKSGKGPRRVSGAAA